MSSICRINKSIHCQVNPCSSWMEKIVRGLNLKSEEQQYKQVQYSMGISRTLVALLFVVLCILSAVNGAMNISIQPSDLTVESGSRADFECTISCEYYYTHTLYWYVGDHPLHIRRFFYDSGRVQKFVEDTGIDVDINETDPCMGPGAVLRPTEILTQILNIYVSTPLMNRTAVQCAAIRNSPELIDFYSFYSMLMVEGDGEGTPSTATTDPPSSQPTSSPEPTDPGETTIPTPTAVYCENTTATVTVTNYVGVTVTQTLTVTETVTATPAAMENPSSAVPQAIPLRSAVAFLCLTASILLTVLLSSSSHL